MTKDKALRLALEEIRTKSVCQTARTIAKDALRKALEQPEPEPVADVRLYEYSGVAKNGVFFEAVLREDATVSDGDKLYTSPPKRKPLTDDTLRLDALDQNCWDLRCFSHSHGEEYGWRVIEHHMAKPHERTVAEVYSDDPRKAIDAAIEAAHGIKGGA